MCRPEESEIPAVITDTPLVLQIERLSGPRASETENHRLYGDASFIWDQLGTLLVDPLVCKLSVEQDPDERAEASH
jgi:hypothetical protein